MFRQATIAACFAALLACGPAQAVQERDEGTYVVLNAKGEPTDKVFRVLRKAGDWAIEDRMPDGAWVDVTCSDYCRLSTSTPADIQRFFSPAVLAKITPECVHNKVFAFCACTSKSDAGFRSYVFVVLNQATPALVGLARVPSGEKPGR
jgi:hypothetical protein